MKSTYKCLHKMNVVLHCICEADILQILTVQNWLNLSVAKQYKGMHFSWSFE